ncbi:glycine betaine ABC transporter substrate-binding protein [Salisediminibacterium halotolerans]|uniref:glycine betaine ABC transporter substrate-binding protein n=1 Tax=Salisediminibacterium halotolerans TaxID=517425 RepID=UPI000EACF2D1|nr:glycine betaine ABC transporter substrate-binding protein [Salisediminibacterium halotolerans]GEL08595.1 glycine/betaine ABC transporter [Salisediminibacterium halotolerans]
MMRGSLLSTGMLSAALILTACGENNADNTENENNLNENETNNIDEDGNEVSGEDEIEIGLNNWAENVAVANMWGVLLEEEGYDVELTMSEKAPIWEAVATDGIDLSLEVWLPTTDEPFYEDHGDDVYLSDEIWFEGTGLGLAVPEYVDIDSMDELNDNVDMFDGEIVGIDAGASLTRLTDEAIETYDLEYEQLVSSESSMLSALDQAYSNEEPVLVTMWNPHWAFSEYDIKYLDDPENAFGEAEDIHYKAREDFPEVYPEVKEWLDNWMMDDETLGDLMSYIENSDDEREGAEDWIEDNRDLIDEWME